MFHENLYDFEYEYYDDFYQSFREDLEFLKTVVKDGERILELMCGTGRIIEEFKDHEIWGIDNNEHMLSIAREKFKGLKNVHIENQDVLKLHDLGTFDTIIIPLNSFLLFGKDEQLQILKSCKNMLSEDGKIVVDILNGFPYFEHMVYHGDTIKKDEKIISRFFVPTIDHDFANILYFYDIFEDKNYARKYASIKLRIMYLKDMEILTELSGLKIRKVFGNYSGGKYTEDSERLITLLKVRL
ncbi:MAG: class I SAM-dependent methyltransferase [Thermoplasmata archaeon]